MKIKIGVAGAGSFSLFSVDAFLQNTNITVSGVFDIDPERSLVFASKYNARIYNTLDELIKSDDINLIYISTPPGLHYEQSKSALLEGKHVICEKPAALQPSHAVELCEMAEKKGLLYVVNLMQRYNPLYQKVTRLIEEKLLGEFLHAYFENYASDEPLNPDHWMWKPEISGGIFIEHAVHFFDMFEGWLGQGTLISSQKLKRPGYGRDYFSRVQSTGYYAGGIVNLYHGFDQPGRMDRQEIRLLFERGDVTLHEWIPVQLQILCLITDDEESRLSALFPGATIEIITKYQGKERTCHGNFKEYVVDKKIRLIYGSSDLKTGIYQLCLKEMIADQVQWIYDKSHQRVITGWNGANSLKMAWESEQKAQIIG